MGKLRWMIILGLALFYSVAMAEEHAVLKAVSDGDTLKVTFNGHTERLRLIGIDTPESKPNERAYKLAVRNGNDLQTTIALGLQARNFVQSLLPPGMVLRLEFDVEQRDKYNRLLAYVYRPDGRMLNEEIVTNGYAYSMTVPPNVRYRARFKEAFEKARKEQRGLWKHASFDPAGNHSSE